MKAKLFSTISLIIASAAILASCTPTNTPSDSSSEDTPEAEVVSISQVTGWDYESSTPVLEGQLVRIEDAVVTSTYSATSISVAQYVQNSDTDVDISAVEVVLAEENDGTYDIKDIVTIEGTVTSTNGRPQIVDATIQWGAAGQETCDYHQNEQGEWVGGGSLWYSGINSGMERSWFDKVTRTDSSKWYEFDVQFVTVPTVTAGQETHYWIVFPGENTDLTDENNYSPIDVTIPALTEAQATVVNEWASQFEAGDFFSFFGQVWFNNYASLIQPYASWRFNGTNLPVEIAGLYTSWDDAAADLNTVYSATFPNFDFSSVFSWRVSHLTGTDGNPFAYVVANVTDGETSFLTDFFHVNEAGTGIELDTYESQGWYYAGLFQDSSTGAIFVDLYNDELTDETSSSTATTLVEISYSTSTVELYIIALSEEGYVDNGGATGDAASQVKDIINQNFANEGMPFGLEWDADYEEWFLGVSFGPETATDEATLKGAAEQLVYFTTGVSTLVYQQAYNDPANGGQDLFGVGIPTYIIVLVTTSYDVAIQIVTYTYNGKLTGQMSVYLIG